MTFNELGINDTIIRAISELGFVQPMPVQEQVIPYLLNQNENENEKNEEGLIALAQTGTGKTAAFGLPLLQSIDVTNHNTQAVVMSPTRELCLQICDDLRDFGKYIEGLRITAVYGGAPIDSQIRQLRKGSQIIIATPGRLVDLLERGVADISKATTIVLDEADEMLNMGFSDSINAIFEQMPMLSRRLLFSATMSREVERVARKYIPQYKEIVVGSRNEGAENVDHTYYMVHAKDKYLALKRIVDYYPKIFAIVFCRTKMETQEIADKLIRDGYNAESLHGDLSQPQRDQTMQKFRQHTVQLLVATDVAARGLDVDDLTHVINYGMPDDTESYTHRSGRTGRAGKKGSSIAIIHQREQYKVRDVEKIIGKKFTRGTLPTPQEICTKQLFRVMDHISKVDVDETLIAPFMEEIQRHFEYFDKEDIIKKIVMMEFGRFLDYYKDAPEIEVVSRNRNDGDNGTRSGRASNRRTSSDGRDRGPEHRAEKGYTRLFINLGKDEGFYPGEVMKFINQNVTVARATAKNRTGRTGGRDGGGMRQEVGHIDLMSHYCFIEVPDRDAKHVADCLNGLQYKGREVRCNKEEGRGRKGDNQNSEIRSGHTSGRKGDNEINNDNKKRSRRYDRTSGRRGSKMEYTADDWRELMTGKDFQFRGDEPDFTEEGWARRKPRGKKK